MQRLQQILEQLRLVGIEDAFRSGFRAVQPGQPGVVGQTALSVCLDGDLLFELRRPLPDGAAVGTADRAAGLVHPSLRGLQRVRLRLVALQFLAGIAGTDVGHDGLILLLFARRAF